MHQHAIESNAIFACPVCEAPLVARSSGASASSDASPLQVANRGVSGDEGGLLSV